MDRTTAIQKAKALAAQMTVEEKASQLRFDAPAIPRLGMAGASKRSWLAFSSTVICAARALAF